jgi:hypothetical protein
MGITPAAYAKRRGVSDRAVRKAIESGRLVKSISKHGNRWLVEPDIADLEWDRNTAPQKVRSAGQINTGKARARGEDVVDAEPMVPGAGRGQATYSQAKAAAEGYRAMLLKLDYQERDGSLVRKADVERQLFEVAKEVKDAVLRLGPLMVGEIAKAAGGLTPEQRQDVLLIIERHQTKALEALSNARLR